eukprot:1158811-Prymnesium_polylepis.1
MSRGDPSSDTIVIFTHTTYEHSGIPSYYKMFYGWTPPFYAVALDRPGDSTTSAIRCNAGGMEDCTPPQEPTEVDCTDQYLQLLAWMHGKIAHLSAGRARVVVSGISFGGVLMEDYIRWRARLGDFSVDGLILTSNPTSDIWCDHMGGLYGE